MQVKGSIVQGSPVPAHGGCAAEEVSLPLAPCQAAAGGWDALPASPWARQLILQPPGPSQAPGAGEAKSHPKYFRKQPDRQEKRHEQTPEPATALPTYPHSPGVQRKTPPSQPPATPYSHHSSFTFIKNTVPLFPPEPTSYLLTVVKYYHSSPPSQAGFPLNVRYPPLFFFLKLKSMGTFFFLSAGVRFAALMLQSGE